MSDTQTNSVGGWSLLGRMVNYAASGTATSPTVTTYANQTGPNVGIYGTYTSYAATTGGGAYSGLLPAVARAVDAAGDVPLVTTRLTAPAPTYTTAYSRLSSYLAVTRRLQDSIRLSVRHRSHRSQDLRQQRRRRDGHLRRCLLPVQGRLLRQHHRRRRWYGRRQLPWSFQRQYLWRDRRSSAAPEAQPAEAER